jgi:glycosyltransferase involved in cell wall biosynthesis
MHSADNPLVSVVMPAYNAGLFITDAITSVLNQTHSNVELIVVNDGSTDNTEACIQLIGDSRIHYFSQPNAGVSAARNKGIEVCNGQFLCFLDADDVMPPNSIKARLDVFRENPHLEFVGGAQEQWNHEMTRMIRKQIPSYRGVPRKGLLSLDEGCFINCGTWLIRRRVEVTYRFPKGWTHGEDLAFFLSIAHLGELGLTTETAQYYRRTSTSAMTNLNGLMDGYIRYLGLVNSMADVTSWQRLYLRLKIAKIVFLSFLGNGQPRSAIVQSFRILTA